jgi:Zn-dependent peptidase ImmA (M78 family)
MKIKSVFYDYEVDFIPNESSDNHGLTDKSKKKIFIEKNINPQVQRETLLHEILHVVCEDMYFFKDDEKEEEFIRKFSPRLMHILCNSEEATNFILGKKIKSKKGKK